MVRLRKQPITFWCRSRNLFHLLYHYEIGLFFSPNPLISLGTVHGSWWKTSDIFRGLISMSMCNLVQLDWIWDCWALVEAGALLSAILDNLMWPIHFSVCSISGFVFQLVVTIADLSKYMRKVVSQSLLHIFHNSTFFRRLQATVTHCVTHCVIH